MTKTAARILGPYSNGVNYRLVVVDGARRKSITAPTREAALLLRQRLAGELHSQRKITVGEALEEYIEQRVRERGILPPTVIELRRLTQDFLPAEMPLDAVNADEARRLYRELSERLSARGTPLSPNTHHVMLRRARALFRFVVERGDLSKNPFEQVKPVGQSRAGKTQLTIDEARQWRALALMRANQGDEAALGVLLLLLLGLRASEVLAREARDVDDDARVLWVQRGKTKNARRRLEIPDEIQEPLRRLIANKEPSALIFGTNRKGGVRNKAFLWFKVRSLCDAARVPRVCSHSLRGLHSTLALEAGATPHLVAAALGHSSFRITARHYADPNTLINTKTRHVQSALHGKAAFELDASVRATLPPQESTDELGLLLSSLSDEQRERLRKLLDQSASPSSK